MIRDYASEGISKILKHEGGFVDHPDDPGGATNKGITIGTLKRLRIDVDGDGDSDIHDLKNLSDADVHRVYKLFYWDAVQADLLPAGVNYTVADFAVNSGPARAAKVLQSIVGTESDGVIGPKTIAAVAEYGRPTKLIREINDRRLAFLKRLRHWKTFRKGWSRRVSDVIETSIAWAEESEGDIHAPLDPTHRGCLIAGECALARLHQQGAIAI
ncbi:MAG: glycosyl hydrolase 108 family protein [Pseudomonadota bacterium]